jgi:hypothetical protein
MHADRIPVDQLRQAALELEDLALQLASHELAQATPPVPRGRKH